MSYADTEMKKKIKKYEDVYEIWIRKMDRGAGEDVYRYEDEKKI